MNRPGATSARSSRTKARASSRTPVRSQLQESWLQLRRGGLLLAAILLPIWAVSLYGFNHQDLIYRLALSPRNPDGLLGILTMPLVHGTLLHLSVNTGALLALGGLVAWRGSLYLAKASLLILVAGGAVLWVVGREGAHIGASGLVFGFFGLLATRGLFERRFWSILLSLGVVFLYAGLLRGIAPGEDGVSWEGHACGVAAGVFAAWLLSGKKNRV